MDPCTPHRNSAKLCVAILDRHADCIFNFGDILAWNFDLRVHKTGTLAVAIAIWAVAGISLFVITTLIKSRHVRIIGGLGERSATGGVDSAQIDSTGVVEDSTMGVTSMASIPEGVGNFARGITSTTEDVDDSEAGTIRGSRSMSEGVGNWKKTSHVGSISEGVDDPKTGIAGAGISEDVDDSEVQRVPGAGNMSEGVDNREETLPMGSISEGVDNAQAEIMPIAGAGISADIDDSETGTVPDAWNMSEGVDNREETLPVGSISEGVDDAEAGMMSSVENVPDGVERMASVSDISERGTE